MIDRSLNYGRHIIRRFLISALPYKDVLDLGAGSGEDLSRGREISPGASLSAIECDEAYRTTLSGKGITAYDLDIESAHFPFADNSIDIVIMNQVLEHTKEIFWIFHEASRILRTGGKLIIGVPNLASFHNRLFLLFGKQPTQIKTCSAHVRGFTKGDIIHFLENCFPGGYDLRAFGGSNFYPFPPLIARPLAHVFPTMAWGIFFMLEKRRAYRREFLDFPVTQRLETIFFRGTE